MVQLDVESGSDASSIKTDSTPPHEKKARFPSQGGSGMVEDRGAGSEKENMPGGKRKYGSGKIHTDLYKNSLVP